MEVILDSAKAIRLCWIPSAHELLGGTSVSVFGWISMGPWPRRTDVGWCSSSSCRRPFWCFFLHIRGILINESMKQSLSPFFFKSLSLWCLHLKATLSLTASPWLSEDQNRRAGQSSEFGCLGGCTAWKGLNAELLARHLRFLRGFSCFGCFGKWMKINWLLTIHSKAYEYRVKANLFIILTFTFSYSFFGSFSMKVYLR